MSEHNYTNSMRWVAPEFPTNGSYHHDPEITWIDAMEAKLPRSIPILETPEAFSTCGDDLARLRIEIQVATQHCNVAYFANLETLLRGIGQLRRSRAVTWCSFGTLADTMNWRARQDSLYPIVLLDRRLDTLAVLYTWLCGLTAGHPLTTSHPKCTYGEREEWIWTELGESTPIKRWLVGHLCRVIKQGLRRPWLDLQQSGALRYPLYVPFKMDAAMAPDDNDVLSTVAERLQPGEPENSLRRMMARPEEQPCHFRFDRWIDNLISAVGHMDTEALHAPPEDALSVQTWMAQMRAWVRAIDAWIDDVPLPAACAQSGATASIVRRVYAMLGTPSPLKLWFTASLSKTMRSLGDSLRPQDEAPPQRFLNRSATGADST